MTASLPACWARSTMIRTNVLLPVRPRPHVTTSFGRSSVAVSGTIWRLGRAIRFNSPFWERASVAATRHHQGGRTDRPGGPDAAQLSVLDEALPVLDPRLASGQNWDEIGSARDGLAIRTCLPPLLGVAAKSF